MMAIIRPDQIQENLLGAHEHDNNSFLNYFLGANEINK